MYSRSFSKRASLAIRSASRCPACLAARAPLFADHVFDGHVLVRFDLAALGAALGGDGFDLPARAGEHAAVGSVEDDGFGRGRPGREGCGRRVVLGLELGYVGGVAQLGAHELGAQAVQLGLVHGRRRLDLVLNDHALFRRWGGWSGRAMWSCLGHAFGIEVAGGFLLADIARTVQLSPVKLHPFLPRLVELEKAAEPLDGDFINGTAGLLGNGVDRLELCHPPLRAFIAENVVHFPFLRGLGFLFAHDGLVSETLVQLAMVKDPFGFFPDGGRALSLGSSVDIINVEGRGCRHP
jgi:hypothetical protein